MLMLTRAFSKLWAATMTVLAAIGATVRLTTGVVGTTDDVRNLQDATWWEQSFAWFMTIPAWIPVSAFFIFAAIFAVQLALDASEGSKALKAVKASNDKAWEFEPEFRDKMDAISRAVDDLAQTKALFSNLLAEVRLLQENQDSQREFLSLLIRYIRTAGFAPIEIQRNMMNMRQEIVALSRGFGVQKDPDGREWVHPTAHVVAEEFLGRNAALVGLDAQELHNRPVTDKFRADTIAQLGGATGGHAGTWLETHITQMNWYHQMWLEAEKRTVEIFNSLDKFDLDQSPSEIKRETRP